MRGGGVGQQDGKCQIKFCEKGISASPASNAFINAYKVEYFNNKVICDLVEIPRTGILPILDEACYTVGPISDKVRSLPFLSKAIFNV
ncbi:unnamed protein product [Gongylonema pulchrum]|uniref:Amidase domain-containing protein n=1 Tax=Gongylonema pulchrum TaxID=637853 RepID=A0A183DK46_9BILA|nr:unnamed protein product [Gongylonema pulchrum]